MKPEIKTIETHWDNGQLLQRCTLKEGKLDGLYESWHENGKPWKRRTYKDGVLVEDLLKQEETKMETSEATGKNESVRITLKGVEFEVDESNESLMAALRNPLISKESKSAVLSICNTIDRVCNRLEESTSREVEFYHEVGQCFDRMFKGTKEALDALEVA